MEQGTFLSTSSNPDIRLLDGAIQALVGAGLKLEYCAEIVGPAPDDAAKGIGEVLDRLEDLIIQIRARMYELSFATKEYSNG